MADPVTIDHGQPVVDIYDPAKRKPDNKLIPGDIPLAPVSEDLGADYLAGKKSAQAGELLDRFRSKPAPPADQRPGSTPPVGPRVTPRVTEPDRSTLDRAVGVVKDIGGGVVETPTQVIGGVTDAVRHQAQTLDEIGNWVNGHILDTTVPLPSTGSETVDTIIGNPLKGIADNTPKINDPKTATGGIVRGVSEFITGFVVGGKLLDAVKPMGQVPRMFAAGAYSDAVARDPDGGRLADLVDQYPALKNPISDYLKSDPGDSEVEKRFKNALEGLGMGGLTQGLALSLKYLKTKMLANGQASDLKAILDDPKAYLRQTHGEITPEEMQRFGDAKKGAVVKLHPDEVGKFNRAGKKLSDATKLTETGIDDAVTAKGLLYAGVDPTGKNVYINMARIEGPDDLKKVLQTMADTFAPEIDKAKRGVQSNEATKQLADELGLSLEDVLSRRAGQAFNAEQSLAARRLLNTVGTQLLDYAKKAAQPGASQLDMFAFRKLLAMHQAVQAEVLGARAEAARALQAWSIPAGQGGIEMSKSITAMIDSMGGADTAQDLARKMSVLSGKNDPASINKFVRDSMFTKTENALRELYVNSLLSGPATHLVNFASNAMVALQQIGERRIAEALSSLWGGGVAPGEASVMMSALVPAAKDAFRAAWLALKTGESSFGATRIDSPRLNAISSQAFGLPPGNALSGTVDFIGTAINVPSRLMMTGDEFFKGVNYKFELYAQAQRQAWAEGLTGEALTKRIAELAGNPTESMRLLAADQAHYATFSNKPGPLGQSFMDLREKVPAGWYLFPFIKTPSNIINYTFERSPLAPVVSAWRSDVAAGGARRDLALARMATGTTIMMLAADYADSGFISGGGPFSDEESGKAARAAAIRQGWQPYSIKVGDKWVSYNRMDPLGMTLGLAADLVDLKNRHEVDGGHMDEFTEIMGAGLAAVARTTNNKTYMQSFSNFFEMASQPGRNSTAYFNKLAASSVPMGGLLNAVGNATDGQQRETMKMLDYMQARIAGLREKLPLRLDLWGEPIGDKSGFGSVVNTISPVQVSQTKPNPIDAEIEKQRFSILPIEKKSMFNGVPTDFTDWPKVYEAYVKLAGNELKHPAWGLGLKDMLDQIVTGKHPLSLPYQMASDGPDGGKELQVKKLVSEFRQLAQGQIMQDPRFAEFTSEVTGKKQNAQDKKLPTGITIH